MNNIMTSLVEDTISTRYSLLSRLEDRGDQDSWRDFFNTYWRFIYSVALKSGLTEAEAQDVVQETVISVARDIHKFKRDRALGSFKGWLRNLTRWRIADQLRKRIRTGGEYDTHIRRDIPLPDVADIPDPATEVAESVWDEEWRVNLLNAAMETLKPCVKEEHYQIFDLYVLKQWPARTVADVLGVNVGMVYLVKYLYDSQAGTNFLISQNPSTLQPANGASDSPDISPDGRFIAYRSAATDLVAASTAGLPQLIVYDRLLGTNTLLSTAAISPDAGDNRSLTPVFSGDSRTLVFATWASNLASEDFNHFSDIFAFEFLYLNITLGAPGQGPTLTWPYVAGHSYQVQYKNNLADSVWQQVAGIMNINGNQASLADSAPVSDQRFYRVVAQ